MFENPPRMRMNMPPIPGINRKTGMDKGSADEILLGARVDGFPENPDEGGREEDQQKKVKQVSRIENYFHHLFRIHKKGNGF